jgi:hypothetical protein
VGGVIDRIDPIYVAVVILVAMLGAWGASWWRGRKAKPEPREDPGIKFTDAAVTLLGPLLAFLLRCLWGDTTNGTITVSLEPFERLLLSMHQ